MKSRKKDSLSLRRKMLVTVFHYMDLTAGQILELKYPIVDNFLLSTFPSFKLLHPFRLGKYMHVC